MIALSKAFFRLPLVLCLYGLGLSSCSTGIFEDILSKDKKGKPIEPLAAVSFNSSEIPDMDAIQDLTLLQLSRRTLHLTKMIIRNDEFYIDEYRYYSVQTAFEDLVYELKEDINQYWTVQQHLNDLEVDPSEFNSPSSLEESDIAWAVAEELLDIKINQIGNITKKSRTEDGKSEDLPKENGEEASSGEACDTPGKDKGDWKHRLAVQTETSDCVSHVHFLFGSVKRDSVPLLRDAACQDFAFAMRVYEQQRTDAGRELTTLTQSRLDQDDLERGKQLRIQQITAIYGFVQSAKMYMNLQCVGHGKKPGEY